MEGDILLKYAVAIQLYIYGDSIGYMRGLYDNEINKFPQVSNKRVFEFVGLGGLVDLQKTIYENLIISDDSIFMYATLFGLSSKYNTSQELIDNIATEYINILKNDDLEYYGFNSLTLDSLKKIKKTIKWNKLPYNKLATGSDAISRALLIGFAFYKPNDIRKLISVSIESARITHNNAIAYLGALTVALFGSYAFQKIKPNKWIYKLLEVLNGKEVDEYIKKVGRDVDNYMKDKYIFITYWEKYMSMRFDDKKNFLSPYLNTDKEHTDKELKYGHLIYPNIRSKWYNDNFHITEEYNPGSNGLDAGIIAYDIFLESNGSFEKLLMYSSLHSGKADATGSIACGLYGAYYSVEFMDKWEGVIKYLDEKKYGLYKDEDIKNAIIKLEKMYR